MNVPRALLLVLALLHAGGIVDLVHREACAAECERNGCQDCIPGDAGPECPCHSPSTTSVTPPLLAVASTAPAARASIVDFMADERSHASPDPREILHVPRSYVV